MFKTCLNPYFVVDTNAPGVTVGKSEHKMGLRGTGLNPIYYDNVVIPKENMIGKPGQGLKVVSSHHNAVRTGVSAAAVGMAQGAIDLAVEYAKGRMLHGKALSSFQNTQFVLAECQTKVDAARLMVYQSAKALDEGKQEYYIPLKYSCCHVDCVTPSRSFLSALRFSTYSAWPFRILVPRTMRR